MVTQAKQDKQLIEITQQAAAKAKELGLNYRQESFAHLVANNVPQTTAYKQAGYATEDNQARANASALIANHNVSQLIDYLRQQSLSQQTFTRTRKRQELYRIGTMSDNDLARIAAIKTDNQMTGDDAPIKVDHNVTLSGIWSKLMPTNGLPSDEVIDLDDDSELLD